MSDGMSGIASNAVRADLYRSTGSAVNRAVPVASLAEWQVRAIEKVASLDSLRPNWDSYGSRPTAEGAVRVAIGIIRASQVDSVAIPRVVPMSGGGIHFEWSVGRKSFEFEVHNDSAIDTLVCVDDTPVDPSPAKTFDGIFGAGSTAA